MYMPRTRRKTRRNTRRKTKNKNKGGNGKDNEGVEMTQVKVKFKTSKDAADYAQRQESNFENISENWNDDKEVVLATVAKFPWNIQYASPRLRQDKEVVLTVLRTGDAGYHALRQHSPNLQLLMQDKAFALKAVETNPHVFTILAPTQKMDEDFVFAAAMKDPMVVVEPIRLLLPRRDFIRKLVAANPKTFQVVSFYLDSENDAVFINEILALNGLCIEGTKDAIRGNRTFALTAMLQNVDAFNYIDDMLRRDHTFLEYFIFQTFDKFKKISKNPLGATTRTMKKLQKWCKLYDCGEEYERAEDAFHNTLKKKAQETLRVLLGSEETGNRLRNLPSDVVGNIEGYFGGKAK